MDLPKERIDEKGQRYCRHHPDVPIRLPGYPCKECWREGRGMFDDYLAQVEKENAERDAADEAEWRAEEAKKKALCRILSGKPMAEPEAEREPSPAAPKKPKKPKKEEEPPTPGCMPQAVTTALVTPATLGWTAETHGLLPGAYAVVLAGANVDLVAMQGRTIGLELRDTLLVLLPGPRSSFALLFRKPLVESTIMGQVEKTGTGAFNVDASRIATHGEKLSISKADPFHNADGNQKWNPTSSGAIDRDQHPNGRWPSNMVLIHGPACRNLGTMKAPATSIHGTSTATRRTGVHAEAKGHQTIGRVQPVKGYADENGTETIAAWSCQPDCPVRLLDEQSGDRRSAYPGNSRAASSRFGAPLHNPARGNAYAPGLDTKPSGDCYADAGGASRFYPQMGSPEELIAWLTRLVTPPVDVLGHPPA